MKADTAPDSCAPRGHEEKRISIVETAADVFVREGYAGANIDLIAAQAGVSRQTIYNHHGDKQALFIAVVRELAERTNAGYFETISTFPDHPGDLQADLAAFAVRLNRNCICNRDGMFLRKLVQAEGERYPDLFAGWRDQGPARSWAALAARFARLAHSGHLAVDDPDLAARQFLALINADLHMSMIFGAIPDDEALKVSATNAVRTFLRAFGLRS